ncbi:hypothetical protein ABPG72_008295 [Tetrahymena utriculariae]
MNPQKSSKLREKFRTIHYIFYIEYERLEFLFNYPINLLNMDFVNREDSKKKQSIVVMDLDELEKRLSKGYRVYKKIRTTLNLKDDWDFIKLKILFMRQYSQLFMDDFKPDLGYFYLQKADEYVEKRKKINRSAQEDDVNFYKYLVEIDRSNYFILTNQYSLLLEQCETYIECASKLEEYKKKPISILVPFRIYVGCGMIYEFFNQDNDLVVNSFLRGVQIIEKNIDDVGRYFLQNDLLIYVQAYVKIVKCKLRLRDYENAELWARSTLTFIEQNYYLLRLEADSNVIKKIKRLHSTALKELIADIIQKSENIKKQDQQQYPQKEESTISPEQESQISQIGLISPLPLSVQVSANVIDKFRLIKLQNGANTNRNYNSPANYLSGGDTFRKTLDQYGKSKFEIMVKNQDGKVVSQKSPKDTFSSKIELPQVKFEGFEKVAEQAGQNNEATSNQDNIQDNLQSLDPTTKNSGNSQVDEIKRSILSRDQKDKTTQKDPETQRNFEIFAKEEKKQLENEQIDSDIKIREKQQQIFLKNLAQRLVDETKPRNSTNLKPISQIRQEIDENQEAMDLIQINSQFFDQQKFFNLPKQFPTALANFDNGLELQQDGEGEVKEDLKQEQEKIDQDKQERMISIKKITSQITNSEESNSSKEEGSSPRSRSNSMQSNRSKNQSQTSIRRGSRLSIKSLQNIEAAGSEKKIGSYTLISGQKKRNSFLEVPNANYNETQDRSLSNTKNIILAYQEHSQSKINSTRMIHQIPENYSEDDSPMKKIENQKQGSLNHIKFESSNEKRFENKNNNYQQGYSFKSIPITPTSLADCLESPKSYLYLHSSQQIDATHFASEIDKNGPIPSDFSTQKSPKQEFEDLNNNNLSRVTKINRSDIVDTTINSERKQKKKCPSFSDLNESQNKSTAINFQIQKISSFNNIEQIPEACEDDSPHKFTKSRDPTPQYFYQIKLSSQQSVLHENAKIESNKEISIDKEIQQTQQTQLNLATQNSKNEQTNNQQNQALVQEDSQKSQQNLEKPEQLNNQDSISQDQAAVYNQQQILVSKNNKRPSLLVTRSQYQSPFSTPNKFNLTQLQNLIKANNFASSSFNPSPEINSPNSIGDIKIDFSKVQSINQTDRDYTNKLSDSKNLTDSQKDVTQLASNRLIKLTKDFNKQFSSESNEYFTQHRNSFSIQLSENNYTQVSLHKLPYSSDNQTPANHFLGSSNYFMNYGGNNVQTQGGQNNLLIPQQNNQTRKKSLFSDLKEQQELQNKLEKIQLEVEKIDTDKSSCKAFTPKRSKYSLFSDKDFKQIEQNHKFQEYLTKTETRVKQVNKWYGGNLNIFFKNESSQSKTKQQPVQQSPQKKIEYPQIIIKSGSKNKSRLDESEQSIFQFQQKKIDLAEQSFKLNLDYRPSIITPSNNTLTPFLGQNDNFQQDIKSFSQGLNYSNLNQVNITPDNQNQLNINLIKQEQKSSLAQIQKSQIKSEVPLITLQIPEVQGEQIQAQQKNNLEDQLKAEPSIVIFQNKVGNQQVNPNLNHRRFSSKDQSAFKQIIQAKARSSMVDLDYLQKQIIIQTDLNQPSLNTQQNQDKKKFFSQQISPVSLRQSSPKASYFPSCNSNSNLNSASNMQQQTPSQYNSPQINLKQNSTPKIQQTSLSHQVSPISDRQVATASFTKFFPNSKSQQNSKLSSPYGRQQNEQKIVNEDVKKLKSLDSFNSKAQTNFESQQQSFSKIQNINDNQSNSQGNTQNGQQNKKIIRIMSKLSSRDHLFSMSPEDMYLFQYNNPKLNSQAAKNGNSEFQIQSQSTKSSYPAIHDSKQNQQTKQIQQNDNKRKFNSQTVNAQQRFIGIQAPQQLQQYHKINQSGVTNQSDQNKIQNYQQQHDSTSKCNKATGQTNLEVYRFQTEGDYEETWKDILAFKQDLIQRPSNSSSHRRRKTQTSTSKVQTPHRYSTEEISYENLQNQGKFLEYWQGQMQADDEEQMQDETTVDDENLFSARSYKMSNKKNASLNNFGIFSDYKLDSSSSQGLKKTYLNQPFTFSEPDIDRYIIQKDIQEVVYLQNYFQNQYPKDFMNSRECRQNIFKKIAFKKQLSEDDQNTKNDYNSIKQIQVIEINENSQLSEQQKDKIIKLKQINSIMLDNSNSICKQEETDSGMHIVSSKDTNYDMIKSFTQRSKEQMRNSFDLEDRGKMKNQQGQIKNCIPQLKQKKIFKYQYQGFSQAYQENEKKDIFYELNNKNQQQEEQYQKENIVYDDTSSNTPSNSSESESQLLNQSQTIEEKSNAIIQKQFIQFFEDKFKEYQDLQCSIDYLKYPSWVISTQRRSKTTANIIFRTIKNQLSFTVDELFLFPDNLLNNNASQQNQDRDNDKSSFENKVKAIREKLIVQVCDTNTTNIQKESLNQFQYLTFRNSILQSLQIQTNIKKIPVQDKITTIWPIVLCALLDYFKKSYKIQFIIPRIKSIIFQGTQCVDKSIQFQKTNKVQFFIEQNHLIPFGIDAISASLIQVMLDQLVRFHLTKNSKLNGNILVLDQNQYLKNTNKVKQAVTKVQLFLIFDPPINNKPKYKRSYLRLRQTLNQAIYNISYPSEEEKVNNFFWWEGALGRITNIEDSEILINRFKERFINSRWSFLKFLSRQNENQFYFGWVKIFYIPECSEFEAINLFQQQSIKKKFFFQLFLQNYADQKKKMSKIFSLNDFLSLFEENQQPIMSFEQYIIEIIQDKQSKYQNIFLIQCMQQVLQRLKIKESSFFLVLNNPLFGFSNIPAIVSHSLKVKSSYKCSQIIDEPKDEEEQAEVNLNQLNNMKPEIQVQDEILTNQIDEQILTKNSFCESSKCFLPCSFASYIYSLISIIPSQNKVKKRHHFWLSSENETLNVFVRKIQSQNNQPQNQYNQSFFNCELGKSNNLIDCNYYKKYIEDIPLELSQEISFKNTSNSIIINKSCVSNQTKKGIQSDYELNEKDNFQSQYSQQNSSIQSDQNELSPKSQRNKSAYFLNQKDIPKFNILLHEQHEVQIFIYSQNQEVIKCGSTQDISIFNKLNRRYQQIKQIKLNFLRIYQLNRLNKYLTSLISNQVGGKQSQWKRQTGTNSLTLKPIPFEIFKYQLVLNNKQVIKKTKPYQEYMFLHKNSQLGKLIVRVTVYENPQQQNSLSYILSIQQYKYKNKLWKIIFNSEDLKKYFQLGREYTFHSVSQKNSDSQFIIRTEKICRIVLDQIILQKHNIYTQPIFKFQIQMNRQPSHINSYFFHKNHFIEPSFKDSDSQCTFYLEQSVKSTRVVAHFIIKRFEQYIITTILRHIIEDVWILKLYLPQSQRRSISYFSTSDLSNLASSDFRLDWFNLNNNIPANSYHDFMNTYLQKQAIQKNIFKDLIPQTTDSILKKSTLKEALLLQKYTQLDEIKEQSQIAEETPQKKQQSEQIKLINEGFTKQRRQSFLRRLQTNNFEQVGRFLQKNQPFISNLKKISQEINEQLIDQMTNKLNTQSNKFIEISAWEDIIQHLQIVQQNSSIFLQFKQSEKILLYEFLDMKLTVNDKGNFVFIEYHLIPLNDKPLNFMQVFQEINYSTSQNYDILMRYSFYDKLNFFSKRVNLKEALNLYIADGFYQYQMSYMHSTLHYSDLLNICKYITYKITSQSIGSIVTVDQEFKMLLKPKEKDLIGYLLRLDIQQTCGIIGFSYLKVKKIIDDVNQISSKKDKLTMLNQEIYNYYKQDMQSVQNMEDLNQINYLKSVLFNFLIIVCSLKTAQQNISDQIFNQLAEIRKQSQSYEEVQDKIEYLFAILKFIKIKQNISKLIMDSSISSSDSSMGNQDLKTKGGDIDIQKKQVRETIEFLRIELKDFNQTKILAVDQSISNGIQLIYFNIFCISYLLTKNEQTNIKFYFAENAIQIGLSIEQLLKRYFLVEIMFLILFIITKQAKQTLSLVLIKKAFQFIKQNQETLNLESSKLEKISQKLNKLKKVIHQKIQAEQSKNLNQLFEQKQSNSKKDFLQKFLKNDADKSKLFNFNNTCKSNKVSSSQENQENQKSQLILSFDKLKKQRILLFNNHLEKNEFDQIFQTQNSIKSSKDFRKCISLSVKENNQFNDAISKEYPKTLRPSIIIDKKSNEKEKQDQMLEKNFEKSKKIESRERQILKQQSMNTQSNHMNINNHLDQFYFASYACINETTEQINPSSNRNVKVSHQSRFDIQSLLELDSQTMSLERIDSKDAKQQDENLKQIKLNHRESENYLFEGKKNQDIQTLNQNLNVTNNQMNSKFIDQKENDNQSQFQNLIQRVKQATKSKLSLNKKQTQQEYSSLNNTVQTYKTFSETESTFPIKKQKQPLTQLQYPTQSTIPCSSQSSLSKIQVNRYSNCNQKTESLNKIKVFEDYQLSNEASVLNYKRQKYRNSSEAFQSNKAPSVKPLDIQYLSETDGQSLQEKSELISPTTTIVSPLSQTTFQSQKQFNRRHIKLFSQNNQKFKKFLKYEDQNKGFANKENTNDDKTKQYKINIIKKQDTSIQVSQLSLDYNLTKQESNQSYQTYTTNINSNQTLNLIELSTRPQIKNTLSRRSLQEEQKQTKLNQMLQLNEKEPYFMKKQPSSTSLSSRNISQSDKNIQQYLFWKSVISTSIERDLQQLNLNKQKRQDSNQQENAINDKNYQYPFQMSYQILNKKPSIKDILSNRMKKTENNNQASQMKRDERIIINEETQKNNQIFSFQKSQNEINQQNFNFNNFMNQSKQKINRNDKENTNPFQILRDYGNTQKNKIKQDNQNQTKYRTAYNSRSNSLNFLDDFNTFLEQIQCPLTQQPSSKINQTSNTCQYKYQQIFSLIGKQNSKELKQDKQIQQDISHQKYKSVANQQGNSEDLCMLQNLKNNLRIFSKMDKYKNLIESNPQSEIKEIDESQIISQSNIDNQEAYKKFSEEIALSQKKKSQFNQNQNLCDFLEDSCLDQQIKDRELKSENSSLFKLSQQTLINSDTQEKESFLTSFNDRKSYQEKAHQVSQFNQNLLQQQDHPQSSYSDSQIEIQDQIDNNSNKQIKQSDATILRQNINSQMPQLQNTDQKESQLVKNIEENDIFQDNPNNLKIKLQMCENQLDKRHNLVEQLQINYNINSKEFLKKTILNNIQKKYFQSQDKAQNSENKLNLVSINQTDVEYSLNLPSSFIDQSVQKQDQVLHQNNIQGHANTEVQLKHTSDTSSQNKSQKLSQQQVDNCSMINFHHSFSNSLIHSEKVNNQNSKTNPKKSKYFQQSQNNQIHFTPSHSVNDTLEQEQNDKENTQNQSPNLHTTKQTFQSYTIEEDYQNGIILINNCKKLQPKKIKRLKSYSDIFTAQREHPEKFLKTKATTSDFQKQSGETNKIDLQQIVENRSNRSSSCFLTSDYNTLVNQNQKVDISFVKSPQSPLIDLKQQDLENSSNIKSQTSQFFQKYESLLTKENSIQNSQQRLNCQSPQSKLNKSYLQLLKPNISFSSLFQNQKIFIECKAELDDKLNQIIAFIVINRNLSLRYSIEYSPQQLIEDMQSLHHSQSQTIWPLLSEYLERDLLKKHGVLIQYDYNNIIKLQKYDLKINDDGNIVFTKNEGCQILNQSDKQGVVGIKNIVESLFKNKNCLKAKQKLVGRVLTVESNLQRESGGQLKKIKSVSPNNQKKQIQDFHQNISDSKFVAEYLKPQDFSETIPIQFFTQKKNKRFYLIELSLEFILDKQKQVYKEDQMSFLIRIYSSKEKASIHEKKLPIKSLQLIDFNIILSIIKRIKLQKCLIRYQKEYLRQYLQLYLSVSDDLTKIDIREDIYLASDTYQIDEWSDQDQYCLNKQELSEQRDDQFTNFKFGIFNQTFNQLRKQFYHEKIILNLNSKVTYQNNEQFENFQSQSANIKQPIIEQEEEFNLNNYVKYRRIGIRSSNYQKDLFNLKNYLKDKVMYLEFSAQNFIKLNYRVIFILNKSINPKTNKIFTQVIMKKYSSYMNESLLVYKTNCKRAIQLFNLAYTQKCYKKKMNLHSIIYKNQTNFTFFLSNSQNRDLSYHYSKFYTSPVYFQILPPTPALKTMLLKNQPTLSSFFFHRELLFLEKTEYLGKLAVKVDIYQNFEDLFVTFTLNEYQKRTKSHHFIMSKQDIEIILKRPLVEDVKHMRKELLISISKLIVSKMYLEQNFINKTLKIKFEGNSYKNSFDQSQYFPSVQKQVEIKSNVNVPKNVLFLQKEHKMERTIFHSTAIHNNEYSIATIQRHLHFDAFIFNLYFPKSSRKIRAYLTLNELKELNQEDMRAIMREILQRLSIVESKDFSFQDYLNNSIKSHHSKLQSKPSFNFESYLNQQSAIKLSKLEYKVSKEIKEFDKFSKERNRNFQNLYNPQSQKYRIRRDKIERFKEIRIWEKILDLIQVVQKGEQYFVEIGSSAVIPTIEYLNSQNIRIESTNDSYFAEYYFSSRISNPNTNQSISNNFPIISYTNSEDYDIFLRFFQLGQEKFIQKRLNTRNLLNLQVADGFFKDQANFSQAKILICDLHQITYFISHKISNLDFPEIQSHLPSHRDMSTKSSSSQLINKRNLMRRLVCLVVDEDKLYQSKLTQENSSFTQIVSCNPQMIVTYSFSAGEKQLRICIYIPNSGQQYFSQIYFTELEQKIPLFQVYYNSKLYKKLFRQITVLYKQQLLDIVSHLL